MTRLLIALLLSPLLLPAQSLRERTGPREVGYPLAALINPKALDSLKGERAATPMLREACYYLEVARQKGKEPQDEIKLAQSRYGWSKGEQLAEAARSSTVMRSLLRNSTILERPPPRHLGLE